MKGKKVEVKNIKIEKPQTLDRPSDTSERQKKWLCKGKDASCRSC